MGIIISRFRRKQTTYEILEDIDKEITHLQRNRKANQDRQKKFVTSLLIYSIVVYIIAAVIFYFLYFPDTWKLRFIYSIPLLIFPFLIWGLKKLLHWYFVKRIASNDLALQELRERKKQILEDVMDTETYKKAREILEKFDPTRLRKLEGNPDSPSSSSMNITPTPGTVIHQRSVRTVQQQPRPAPATPTTTPRLPRPPSPRARQTPTPYPSTPASAPTQAVPRPSAPQPRPPMPAQGMIRGGIAPPYGSPAVVPPGPPMPRSVLPRERGTMDRLMDYLVGDGPENRYALICQQCYSHNGMALKEEFEYLTFRCCYCFYVNPARKQRPVAPRLEFFAPRGRGRGAQTASASNEESDDDDIDSEDENSEDSDVDSGGSSKSSALKPADSKPAVASASQTQQPQKPGVDPNAKPGTTPVKAGATSLPKPSGRSIPKPQSSAEAKPGPQEVQSPSVPSQTQGPAGENGKPPQKPVVEVVKPSESVKEIPGAEKKYVSSLPLPSAGATTRNSSARNNVEIGKTSNPPQGDGNTNNSNRQTNGAVTVKGEERLDTDKPGPRTPTGAPAGVTGIPVAGRGIPVRSGVSTQQASKPGPTQAPVTKPTDEKESSNAPDKESAA